MVSSFWVVVALFVAFSSVQQWENFHMWILTFCSVFKRFASARTTKMGKPDTLIIHFHAFTESGWYRCPVIPPFVVPLSISQFGALCQMGLRGLRHLGQKSTDYLFVLWFPSPGYVEKERRSGALTFFLQLADALHGVVMFSYEGIITENMRDLSAGETGYYGIVLRHSW